MGRTGCGVGASVLGGAYKMMSLDGLYSVDWLDAAVRQVSVEHMGDMVWLNDKGLTVMFHKISPRCLEVRTGGKYGAAVTFLSRDDVWVPIMAKWCGTNGVHRRRVVGDFNGQMQMSQELGGQREILAQAGRVREVLEGMGDNLARLML